MTRSGLCLASRKGYVSTHRLTNYCKRQQHWQVLLLFLFTAVGLPAQNSMSAPYSTVFRPSLELQFSNSYVELAKTAMKSSRWDESIRLLDEALRYYPEHADAAYLRGLCGWYLNEPIALIRPYLETALAADNFLYYSRNDASWLLAVCMVQTGQYSTALRFLDSLRPSAKVAQLRIEALRLSGRTSQLYSEVQHFIELYPGEVSALSAWLETLDEDYRDPLAAGLVERLVRLLPLLKADNPDLLLALIPFIDSIDERRFLLREYRSNHRPTARATRLALQYGLIFDSKAVDELFSGQYVPDYTDLEAVYGLLKDDAARNYFANTFLGYSGKLMYDVNRDGHAELVLEYRNGQPSYLAADSDQDGQLDVEITFSAGTVQTALVVRGSTRLHLQYQPWPWLSLARIQQDNSVRTYDIPLGRMSLPLVARRSLAGGQGSGLQLLYLQLNQLPTERSLQMSASRVEDSRAEWIRSATLREGVPLQSSFTDRYGLVSQAWHDENGLIRSEMMDLDGNGYYNARKIWQTGADGGQIALYLDVDSDGDRFFDYREFLIPPYTRSWDLDRNGRFDLALTSLAAGRLVYEFSSQGDGRFDRIVEFQDGKIVRAYRDGRSLEVIKDSNPKVLWLGQKAFDFGTRTPSPGWKAESGFRFYVMPIENLLYVELLD